ncbi:MAG: ATP-binding cassette domain-containing protein [Planctomycetota bacterium]
MTPAPLLRVQGLCFLDWGPIDLDLDAAEVVAVSGSSGSGKSLLLRAIADLDPHRGTLELEGKGSEAFLPPAWRRRVGLVPAASEWWHDTVGSHFVDADAQWLEALGFSLEAMRWPVSRLSNGERQRLSLLRTLSVQPRVLLLDEPTASLDPDSVERVEQLVDAYRREHGAGVVWVSHDAAQRQRVASRSYVMSDRGLVAEVN